MAKILVVEDDDNLARGLEFNLKAEDFEVVRARRGDTAVDLAVRVAPDLITLDVMLPGMSGIDVCRELRRRGVAVPIIMLTARAEELDRILGLEIGADDYVTKPFSVRELVARIRAHLRRESGSAAPESGLVRFGGVEVDLDHFTVTRDGARVDLTTKEFEILRLLIRNRGQVVSRDRLLDDVWGREALNVRNVDTHVFNLRRKIEDDPAAPRYVLSAYGEGYRFAG